MAEEVDWRLDLVKGGGGALAREAIVVPAARRFVVIVDETKPVEHLESTFRLPIEIVRFGWRREQALVASRDLRSQMRVDHRGPAVVTDDVSPLLDAEPPPCLDLRALEQDPDPTPGVVECGLFLAMANEVIVGGADGSLSPIRRE